MTTKKTLTAILLILIFLILLTIGNYQFCQAQPGGSDFLYRWLPTRLVLIEPGSNPYTEEISGQVEYHHRGRPSQGDEPPGDFAYPYYMMLPFIPFSLIGNYILARTLWMTLLEVVFLACLYLSLDLAKAKPGMIQLTILGVFTLFNANFTQGIVDGNPAGLAALCFILSLFFIRKKQDRMAGIFLALSTMKPQLVILGCVFVFLWAIIQKRWHIVLYSMLSGALLVGGSMVFYPDWIGAFIRQLTAYTGYASPSTPAAILSYWMNDSLAKGIALVLTLLSAALLLFYWSKAWKGKFDDLVLAVGVTFTLMPLTGITSAKSNYIAMLLMIALMLKKAQEAGHPPKWANILMLVSLISSWVFRYWGKNLYFGDARILYFDFYVLPLILIGFLVYFTIREKKVFSSA